VPDINRFINSVDLIIAPLISGSGTRIKILEAVGQSKRVISTKIGAEGIDETICGDNLIIVEDNDWCEFNSSIEEFIKKDEPETPNEFFQTYEWGNILNDETISNL